MPRNEKETASDPLDVPVQGTEWLELRLVELEATVEQQGKCLYSREQEMDRLAHGLVALISSVFNIPDPHDTWSGLIAAQSLSDDDDAAEAA
jgi:hypothetical protein